MSVPIDLSVACRWEVSGESLRGFENASAGSCDGWLWGNMTSDVFEISRDYVTMNFSCNGWNEEHGLHLFIEEREEFCITDSIFGIGTIRYALDLREFQGKKAQIKIVDMGSHEGLQISDLQMTNDCPSDAKVLSARRFCQTLDYTLSANGEKYLHLPIDCNERADFVDFIINGQARFNMALRLAKSGKYDFIATIPIEEFTAREITLKGQHAWMRPECLEFFESKIFVSNAPIDQVGFYKEKGRPKLHFTPPYGGMSDMIGFYRYNGAYHIGYLHDPAYNNWNDNASWSFSSSSDLFSWQDQRMVVRKGVQNKRTSGCAFVDVQNRTGFQTGENPPILLYYSVENQVSQRYSYVLDSQYTQREKDLLSRVCISYSVDGGKTFLQYADNPIFLTTALGGHDPEVIYYAPKDKFVMVIHDYHERVPGFDFYESYDLLHWQFMNTLPDFWETPNFYPLPLDGDLNQTYWVLQQCLHDYVVGTFDGDRFCPLTPKQPIYSGAYAMRTFDVSEQGRRIGISAINVAYPSDGEYHGSGAATVPVQISLKSVDGQMKLAYWPVSELDRYVVQKRTFEEVDCAELNALQLLSGLLDLEFVVQGDFRLFIGSHEVFSYDETKGIYSVFSTSGELKQESFSVRLLVDESVADYYLCDGILAGSVVATQYLIDPQQCISVSAKNKIKKMEIRYLRSPFDKTN